MYVSISPFTADPVKALHFAIFIFLTFGRSGDQESGLSARAPECRTVCKLRKEFCHQISSTLYRTLIVVTCRHSPHIRDKHPAQFTSQSDVELVSLNLVVTTVRKMPGAATESR